MAFNDLLPLHFSADAVLRLLSPQIAYTNIQLIELKANERL